MKPEAVMGFNNYYHVFNSPRAKLTTIYVPEECAEWGNHIPASPNDVQCFGNCNYLVGKSADGAYTYSFDGDVTMKNRGFVPSAAHPKGYLSIKPKN